MNAAPVGVFDSGVGGLSVAREIRQLLPSEQLLYLADTAWCPYGGRPLEEIRARSLAVVRELVQRGAKAVVVACNTASGAALEALREEFELPIVGLEPAVKPAAELSRSGRIAVLATEATLHTPRFERLVRVFGDGVEVVPRPGPGLVELVEAGEVSGPEVRAVLEPILVPLREQGVDAVVLGCTHYPFLRDEIAVVMGPGVHVLDSGMAVARQLARVLREEDAMAPEGPGGLHLLTTGEVERVRPVADRLWGKGVGVEGVRVD